MFVCGVRMCGVCVEGYVDVVVWCEYMVSVVCGM